MNAENHETVLKTLREVLLSERQVIDVLLMVIDDWEIRAEVVKNLQRNATTPRAIAVANASSQSQSQSQSQTQDPRPEPKKAA